MRRAYKKKKEVNKTKTNTKRRIVILGLGLAVVLVSFLSWRLLKVPGNFSIVYPHENGDVGLVLYDLPNKRAVEVVVPGDTLANLAMGKGVLRAKSIMRLVETEGLPGQLLADTIMKTLHLPVDFWAQGRARGSFFGGDVPLPLRFSILVHSLRGLREETVELADTSFLVNTRLTDGEDGYLVTGRLGLSLVSLFSDPSMSSGQTAVRLVNRTGEGEHALAEVVATLEVLGAKPVPPLELDSADMDCIVKANDSYNKARIASVFNCTQGSEPPEAFDIELILGTQFLSRF